MLPSCMACHLPQAEAAHALVGETEAGNAVAAELEAELDEELEAELEAELEEKREEEARAAEFESEAEFKRMSGLVLQLCWCHRRTRRVLVE